MESAQILKLVGSCTTWACCYVLTVLNIFDSPKTISYISVERFGQFSLSFSLACLFARTPWPHAISNRLHITDSREVQGSYPGGQAHKTVNQAIQLPWKDKLVSNCPPLGMTKVRWRRGGDKRRRHEAGALKSDGRINLSLPYDLHRL